MPNPPSTGLPNPASYDTSTPGVVLDDVTGLLWQEPDSGLAGPWSMAATYCSSLTLATHDDWRVPSILELASIVDYTRYDPALDPAFSVSLAASKVDYEYWSSTPEDTMVGTGAWAVYASVGFLVVEHVQDFFAVRCVRGGKTAPVGYCVSHGGEPCATVLDIATGLTWQQADAVGDVPLSTALTTCPTPALPGAGWRLPSMRELATIWDFSQFDPPIDEAAFPGTPLDDYWSSSSGMPVAGSYFGSGAWYLYFGIDGVNGETWTGLGRVRCVR
jgi:Protein of unknown function (DUF1566)